jgi:hypothetical protein
MRAREGLLRSVARSRQVCIYCGNTAYSVGIVYERKDIYILLAFALFCWRPVWRCPVASLAITLLALSMTPC